MLLLSGELSVSLSVCLRLYTVIVKLINSSFEPSHASIQSHAPFLTIAKAETKAAAKVARETAASDLGEAGMISTSKGKQLAIEELWRPSGTGILFWEACGIE